TDMTLEGAYAKGWLILTDTRVFSIFETDSAPRVEVPLTKVYGVDIDHFVGNGVLLVATPSERIKMIRFSRSCADDFEEAKQTIEAWVSERVHPLPARAAPAGPDSGRRPGPGRSSLSRCPQCGRAYR